VPKPGIEIERSTGSRVGASARAGTTSIGRSSELRRSSSMPSPVRALTRTTGSPLDELPRLLLGELRSVSASTASIFVSATTPRFDTEQRAGSRDARDVCGRAPLRPRRHEQEEVDPRRSGDHRPDESLVDRTRPISESRRPSDELERRVTEVDRDAPVAPDLLPGARDLSSRSMARTTHMCICRDRSSAAPRSPTVSCASPRLAHLTRLPGRQGSRPRGRGSSSSGTKPRARRTGASSRSRRPAPDGPSVLNLEILDATVPQVRLSGVEQGGAEDPRRGASRRTPMTYTSRPSRCVHLQRDEASVVDRCDMGSRRHPRM
jgi:hypothetical protein